MTRTARKLMSSLCRTGLRWPPPSRERPEVPSCGESCCVPPGRASGRRTCWCSRRRCCPDGSPRSDVLGNAVDRVRAFWLAASGSTSSTTSATSRRRAHPRSAAPRRGGHPSARTVSRGRRGVLFGRLPGRRAPRRPDLVIVSRSTCALHALLPRPQGRAGHRHRNHRLGLPAARGGRWRRRAGSSCPSGSCSRVVRGALHGVGQAVRRDTVAARAAPPCGRRSRSYTQTYLRFVWSTRRRCSS